LEARLIAAAQAGDHAAFDRLAGAYRDRLYRLMVRACHHPQDAEEVASEAFLRAYQRLGQFEGRSSFISWLGRIAANLCFRRRERPEPATRPLEGGEYDPAAGASGPEQEALRSEMRRVLRTAVASLPEPDRTVLRLRDIDALSTAETAAQTGLTEAAVKARLHRARRALRAALDESFFADGN
jgi:RNA polymerase sigma-70 factor (ECF subfamily)